MAEEILVLMADLDDESQRTLGGWYEKLKEAGFNGVQTPDLPFHVSLATFSLDKEAEVVEEMKDIEREVIEERVYAVFSPKVYERRYEDGGLMDKENMLEEVSISKNDITVEITNLTQGNPTYRNFWDGEIQELIETGNYMWNGQMPPPRPFIDETQSVIDTTDRIDRAIERALSNLGW